MDWMRRESRKTVFLSLIVTCFTLTAWPVSTETSPQKIQQPELADHSFLVVPVDSLVVQADTDSRIELVKIPKFARQLDGQRIRMQGIMYPPYKAKNLTHFFFVPETRRRSKHWGATVFPLHAFMLVTTAKGHKEESQQRPFTIEGIFRVEIRSHAGRVDTIYRIQNARIVDKDVHLQFRPAINMFGGC